MMDAIIGLGVTVLGILGAVLWGRRTGAKAERATAAKRQAAADARVTKTAQEKTDEVGRMSDDAVADRLRQWSGKP